MKAKKILFYCLAALLGGCFPILSLQPLATKDTLTFDEQLLGTWADDANDPDSTWQFARVEQAEAEYLPDSLKADYEKVYRLRLRDEEDRTGSFIAALVKLDGKRFLDVFPDAFPSGQQNVEEVKHFYNAFFFVPGHTFIKIDVLDAKLTLRLTNDDALQKLIDADPNAITGAEVEGRIILTARTKDLQAFVIKYADDERVFADEVILQRKRQ